MITLRQATTQDRDWAYFVKKKALGLYVVETWGAWYERIQWEFFEQTYQQSLTQIICQDETPVGTLRVERRTDEIFLSELYLLPTFQNQGIGSVLLEQLKAEARQRALPLQLTVLQVNESARRFYERHGLVCTAEIKHHYVMTYHG
ncbi:GNAT family N-acetyltransferase [Siphonobacter sp.]|uniref:GNAT family N-acetyltransferase n=1 Tax=Siphonobacter sp. TaxID=1869184 RepID=UPI003B3A4511